MLVSPLPGTSRDQLLRTLTQIHSDVTNLRGGGFGGANGWIAAYLKWVATAVQHLSNQVSAADLDRLVLTDGYRHLLSLLGRLNALGDVATQSAGNALVSLEVTRRVDAFDAAKNAMQAQITRWSAPGVFAVPDTSFYIKHPYKLEEVDFAPLLEVREDPIHILLPIVVLDELDGLKDRGPTPHAKWRAGYTLAVIDRIFKSSTGPATLKPEDFSALAPRTGGIPRGEITMELFFDPRGHVRLPINDDELVDRTLAIQALAGREVTFLTYDTGQSTRARNAGLREMKLSLPIGEEPKQK